MEQLDPFLHRIHIACCSTETALRPEVHTGSGGLGALAGGDRRRWIWTMTAAIGEARSGCNSQRTMRRYASEAHLR